MTTFLELVDIEVSAGGAPILSVASLELHGSEVLAVLGLNGAGKSTLLRVAGGLRAPDRGSVLLDGQPATPVQLRQVGAAVLQRPLLQRGTVQHNVEAGLRFHGVRDGEASRLAEPWLERLAITHLRSRSARTLSVGEGQRVSLARALALRPRLLLLDEPFSALDEATRGELVVDLGRALADAGTSALLVVHHWREAVALADRIAVLHGGGLLHVGGVDEVLDHPVDPVSARVLGYENIVDGELATLLAGHPSDIAAVRAADLHCRPEDEVPVDSARVVGTIERVLRLGLEVHLLVRVDGTVLTATWEGSRASLDGVRHVVVTAAAGGLRPLRAAGVPCDDRGGARGRRPPR